VKEVLDLRLVCGKLKYLVRWKGYKNEENTKELTDALENVWELINKYHKYPNPPRKINLARLFFKPLNKGMTWGMEALSSSMDDGDEEGH
jgi:hypothetical protein